MAFEVKIEKLAQAELDEALAWYSLQKEGLDQLLFDAVSEAIDFVLKSPQTYPVFLTPYRKISLKKFPYLLVFHINVLENLVTVLSFWHTSRDPEMLLENLKLYF